MKSRVLIIRDSNIRTEIQAALCDANIIVDTSFFPSEAIDLFLRYDYSLIMFDIDTDGKEVIEPLRAILHKALTSEARSTRKGLCPKCTRYWIPLCR